MTLEELKAKRQALLEDEAQLNSDISGLQKNFNESIEPMKARRERTLKDRYELDRQIIEASARPVDRSNQCTTSKEDPAVVRERQLAEGNSGQHSSYIVLCDEERAKGFVRPVRNAYVHKGKKLRGELVMLDTMEKYSGRHYVALDRFYIGDGDDKKQAGTYLTDLEVEQLKKSGYYGGCGSVTTMGTALAETYARDPKFYGSTFCCVCNKHYPVEQFVWSGTDEVLGT